MDKRLLQKLREWLKQEWKFSKVSLDFGFWLTERDQEMIKGLTENYRVNLEANGWDLIE